MQNAIAQALDIRVNPYEIDRQTAERIYNLGREIMMVPAGVLFDADDPKCEMHEYAMRFRNDRPARIYDPDTEDEIQDCLPFAELVRQYEKFITYACRPDEGHRARFYDLFDMPKWARERLHYPEWWN